MSKKIYIIGSVILSSFLVASILVFPTVKNSFASLTTQKASLQSAISLPNSAEIIKKVHSNKIKDIISKSINPQKDVNDYINSLNKDDLLLSIAEASDDLKNSGNISELGMFASASSQKLMGILTNGDCETIYTNPDYSYVFKLFIEDTKDTERYTKGIKNDKEYNKLLRNMFQDETQVASLRLVSLMDTDDYTIDDLPALETLINSKNSSDDIKANAIRISKRIDKNIGNIYVQKILKNIDQYSEAEVSVALDTLGDFTNQTAIIDGNEDEIDLINNVIKQTKNTRLIQMSTYALTHFKNEKSVATVVENRSKINDDYLIDFYVDNNYLVVENMLNSKDNSVVSTALACVEISPYKNFLPKILELESSAPNNEVKTRLGKIIGLINSRTIERNVKFDGQYK